ncbi:MAG TPA: glycoside hydrolase family 2 TIM barrel-domain containing protein [Candidatus Limnocylindrales bacterium]|nr:glycoside hydrolase family 2 TIM barrel-domain containing protein [Candidatus Limnocylindrales bacterium]
MSDLRRPRLSLDGEWRFLADPERVHSPSDLTDGEPITVPGCWEAQVARPYKIVTAWYHRSVTPPADWDAGRLLLRFGAVMYGCDVYVDGQRIGGHEGGYTPFTIDVTDAMRPGREHQLALRVVNPLNGLDEFPAFSVEQIRIAEEYEPDVPLSEAPHGKQTWYTSHSGPWQSIALERTHRVALDGMSIRADPDSGSVEIAWWLEEGRATDAAGLELEIEVLDPDGEGVATTRVHVDADSGRATVTVADVRAWDIGRPNLYTADVVLLEHGRPVDITSDRFGFREVHVAEGQIWLNGRPIYLLAALDQDFYADSISTPPSKAFLDEQMRLAREMGINMLRCHIKVPDPAYLDAADEAGILVWCELPNWTSFTSLAATRGRDTLEQMVRSMGNHPSIVAWTIINEDWGTRVRWEARDRMWLRSTYDWLKALDSSRIVVDNSACETEQTPNFHVRTDLADFHLYYLAPDNAARWRSSIDDFASRPAWLWSPHGDADERGDEPLVLSEFGGWGLPQITPLLADRRREPWWFATGNLYYRPTGIRRRFATFGLDRVWPTLDALAEATQRHQFEGLQFQIGQMRRHGSIQGYVITELTDLYWEANGLLDVQRRPKAYHRRLADLNSEDAVVVDLKRWDLCSREPLEAEVHVSGYGERPPDRGRVEWRLEIEGIPAVEGQLEVDPWPVATAHCVGHISADVGDVPATADARLVMRLVDDDGQRRAGDSVSLAVLPSSVRRTEAPLRLSVHDPLAILGVEDRVRELGHRIVPPSEAQLIVTTELTTSLLRRVDEEGARVLVLVRTREALRTSEDLARRVAVVLRKYPVAGAPGQRSPWEGDWVSAFSWILPGAFPEVPERNPLDFAFEEVLPDHVLTGYDPVRHRDEVPVGMFVGWVHSPAALVWSFRQGRGAVTLTTLHVAPERGPIATALFEGLLQRAGSVDRRSEARVPVGAGEAT